MTGYTFPQLIDFTRTSAATFVNSSGNIASTAQSRNLLTFTQEFDNAAWTKSNAQIVPNVNPAAATLGAELVTNGDFASGTGWTANAGWAIGSGTATATSTSTSLFGGGFTATAGRLYRVDFDVVSYTSGDLAITVGANYTSQPVLTGGAMAAGRKTVYVVSGTNTSRGVEFYGGTISAVIDNVSVREVVGGALQAPDGTFTADTLVEDTTNAAHTVSSGNATVALGAVTWSVYAKAGTRSWMWLNAFAGGNNRTWFNLANGTVGTTGAGATASITSVGNGWYRCSVTLTSGTTTVSMGINAASADNTTSYAGTTGAGAIFIWGAQLEQVPDASLTLGSEVVANGDFSGGSTGWTVNSGWVVGSGVATATATNSSLISGSAVTAGKTYRVAFDVTSYTAGTLSVRVGTGTARTTTGAGSKILYLTAVDTIGVEFYGGGITLSIDNVSVREITGYTNTPTDYTRNFGGLFPPRFDYDPVTRAPRGLLIEEQRTNLLRRSEEFDNASWNNATPNVPTVTQNTTVAPDGTTTADTLTAATGGTSSQTRQNSGATGTTGNFTGSVYLKAGTSSRTRILIADATTVFTAVGDFSITWSAGVATIHSTTSGTASITDAGGGWYRCVLTANVPSANASVSFSIYPDSLSGTGSVIAWGAQLEAGAFATSYIPTVASQVTRSRDEASINAPNFASWYNSVEGTLLVEGSVLSTAGGGQCPTAGFDDGTASNRYIFFKGTGTAALTAYVNASATGNLATLAANTPFKAALAFNSTGIAACANGGSISTASGTTTGINRLSMGQNIGSISVLPGHVRSVRFYPTRLTNAQLQALTA